MQIRKILSLLLGILVFIFYPILINSEQLVPLILILTTLITLSLKKKNIKIPRQLYLIFGLQLIILMYMYTTYGDPVIYERIDVQGDDKIFQSNMFLSTLMVFFIFSIGSIYGYNVYLPLVIFSNSMLLFSSLFVFYMLILHSSSSFDLANGLLLSLLLGYIFNSISKLRGDDFNVYHLIVFLLLGSFFIIASNRASFLALIIFYIIYFWYPFFTKSIIRSVFFLLLFSAILIVTLMLYSTGSLEFFSDASINLFDKPTETGRSSIWLELIAYISDAQMFGYGIDQSSSYLYSPFLGRSLSSHNTFFEILLRGGAVLLFLILSYIIYIYILLVANSYSISARIGQSMVFVFLWQASWHQVGLSVNIVINILFWLFLGVALGDALKWRKYNAKIANQNI